MYKITKRSGCQRASIPIHIPQRIQWIEDRDIQTSGYQLFTGNDAIKTSLQTNFGWDYSSMFSDMASEQLEKANKVNLHKGPTES